MGRGPAGGPRPYADSTLLVVFEYMHREVEGLVELKQNISKSMNNVGLSDNMDIEIAADKRNTREEVDRVTIDTEKTTIDANEFSMYADVMSEIVSDNFRDLIIRTSTAKGSFGFPRPFTRSDLLVVYRTEPPVEFDQISEALLEESVRNVVSIGEDHQIDVVTHASSIEGKDIDFIAIRTSAQELNESFILKVQSELQEQMQKMGSEITGAKVAANGGRLSELFTG